MPPVIFAIFSRLATAATISVATKKVGGWIDDLSAWLSSPGANKDTEEYRTAQSVKKALEEAKSNAKGNKVEIKIPSSTRGVLSGVLGAAPAQRGRDADSIRATKVVQIPIPDEYKQIFGMLLEGSQIIVHGITGGGKSYWLMQIAKFLAANYGRVQYLRFEEHDETLKLKLDELEITAHDAISFEDRHEYHNSRGFKVVIVDSIQSLDDFGEKHIREMHSKYPKAVFIYVSQDTKEGKARGSQMWPHEVDAVYKVEDRRVYVEKSRYGGKGSAEVVPLKKKRSRTAVLGKAYKLPRPVVHVVEDGGKSGKAQKAKLQIEEEFGEEIKVTVTRPQVQGRLFRKKITGSAMAVDLLRHAVGTDMLLREVFIVLFLNRNNEIKGWFKAHIGGVSSTTVDPKIVFGAALKMLASGIIVCHNHPSGNTTPSNADKNITQTLKDSGKILDITMLDHIIVTETSHFSFADNGLAGFAGFGQSPQEKAVMLKLRAAGKLYPEFKPRAKDSDYVVTTGKKTPQKDTPKAAGKPSPKPAQKAAAPKKATGKKPVKQQTGAPVEAPKTRTKRTVDKPKGTKIAQAAKAAKQPKPAPSASTQAYTGVVLAPMKAIYTDTARFQNRDAEFSEASVQRIVTGFDPNKFDAISVWTDPKTGKIYVLSGHSRFEAFRQMGKKEIPVKYFIGTEAEAIRFARVDANRSATAESIREDVKAYKYERDTAKDSREALQKRWKDRYGKMEAYSHLDPKGKFMIALEKPEGFPYIGNKSMWAGELRKHYPGLTHAQEREIFDYILLDKAGSKLLKDAVVAKVERIASRLDFDGSKRLNLAASGPTGSEARADTAHVQKRLYEIEAELEDLAKRQRVALTDGEKVRIRDTRKILMAEQERLAHDLKVILQSQTALFGKAPKISPATKRWLAQQYRKAA